MFATGTAALALLASGCGSGASTTTAPGTPGARAAPTPPARSGRVLARIAGVAALAPLPDGGVRIGVLRTGVVRDVRAGGTLAGRPFARLRVATRNQRGLLSLALDRAGRTYATWVQPGGHLVVGELAPRRRLVWRGPRTSELANGGHIAFAPDGRLVIGIGDLQRAPRSGVIEALDPRGRPSQSPAVLSRGWSNPFAFAFSAGGELWVADNSPGKVAERLARGDLGAPAQVTDLPQHTAPSGLVFVGPRVLVVCGVVSKRLDVYRLDGSGHAARAPRPLATDCALGVARLGGGRLVYSTGRDLRTVAAPAGAGRAATP